MEIECSLREFGPYEPSFTYADERKKLGRYEGGLMPAAGFGEKRWSVAARICIPKGIEEFKKDGLTEEQVIEGCIKFLNKKPYRARKLPYGTLACRHFIFHDNEISVSLMTDDRNNKHFWGRGIIKTGKPAKRGKTTEEQMIFNETFEDYMSSVEAFLGDIYDVVVDYDPMGLDEYWIDDKVITINNLKDEEHQLFVLLHEAGHVILRADEDFNKMFPGSKTSKLEILKEEVHAWEEARKLAVKLQIPLGKGWEIHVRQAIMKYVHWVRI